MTGWPAHPDDLQRYARSLDDAAVATAVVAARLATAWADTMGREWAARLRLVVRELDHAAESALDLAAVVDRLSRSGRPTDVETGSGIEPPTGSDRPTGESTGVVLGAQTGTRTTPRRGVVVPTLPAPVAPP